MSLTLECEKLRSVALESLLRIKDHLIIYRWSNFNLIASFFLFLEEIIEPGTDLQFLFLKIFEKLFVKSEKRRTAEKRSRYLFFAGNSSDDEAGSRNVSDDNGERGPHGRLHGLGSGFHRLLLGAKQHQTKALVDRQVIFFITCCFFNPCRELTKK